MKRNRKLIREVLIEVEALDQPRRATIDDDLWERIEATAKDKGLDLTFEPPAAPPPAPAAPHTTALAPAAVP